MIEDAVILAGGKSRRMGEDKALLPFKKYKSMSEFQYKKLEKIFTNVYICAKEEKFDFNAKVIKDIYPIHSPLAGLISIFETLDCNEVFILSVDVPFVDGVIIDTLINQAQKSSKYDVIVASSPRGREPLCGVYRRSILPKAKELFFEDIHKINHLLNLLNTKEIAFKEQKNFLNLNTPEDYKEAQNL
ncbi:MAG: molybdenum cofactor guanylyltransferase MobA [Campylobacterales bacterium]|nr:molybdenum cofactor guanylyltransferase MobA [Campylobacterales bacterium]